MRVAGGASEYECRMPGGEGKAPVGNRGGLG